MSDASPLEPWNSFLTEIDRSLQEETQFHCLGGFVVAHVYGSKRPTADVDILSLVARDPRLVEFAGVGSDLHRRHSVYLDVTSVANLPDGYEERLTEVYTGRFRHLRLFVFDPYDIALSKIERNTEKDREDVRYLAKSTPFDLKILERRYHDELRIYLGNPDREDLTLRLWLEMIEEDQNQA